MFRVQKLCDSLMASSVSSEVRTLYAIIANSIPLWSLYNYTIIPPKKMNKHT